MKTIDFIDIHTHSSTIEKGVFKIINPTGLNEYFNPKLKYSIGIHPWDINKFNASDLLIQIEKNAMANNIVAIGETGLDKHIATNFEIQKDVFLKHIDISERLYKPMIIHCVKAYSDIIEIRKKQKPKMPWIIHGFNANVQIGNNLVSEGCFLSYGRFIFNENTKAFKSLTKIPIDHIFFETDDEQIPIQEIYKKASDVLNIELDELKLQISKNFNKIFER